MPCAVPIIMQAFSVNAILREIKSPGTGKAETRRLAYRSETNIKLMDFICDGERPNRYSKLAENTGVQMSGAYWLRPTHWCSLEVGDQVWVRESLQKYNGSKGTPSAQYAADLTPVAAAVGDARLIDGRAIWQWSRAKLNSMYMPRWASRITLEVTEVKVARLQEIDDLAALREGIFFDRLGYTMGHLGINKVDQEWSASPKIAYANVWRALYGVESWRANPWVVAISFRPILRNILDVMKEAA